MFGEGEEWTPKEILAFEKESLGFYISGHPLDRFAHELRRFANAVTTNCTQRGPRAEVIIGGVVSDYQERVIKNGTGKYAFFKLEDQHGAVEFHVASSKLNDFREILTSGEPLLVTGTVDAPFGEGENARERLRFVEAKLLSSIRTERSTIMEVEGEPKKTLIVSFLYGVDLLRGTRIVVDQGPLDATAPYIVCVPPNTPPPFFGCVSQYEITNEMINGMKKGKFLTLQTVFNGQTLSPQLPLADFAKAYDGPPTDLKAEAEAEMKLQEELRKRAKQKEEELAKKSGAAPR